MSPSVRVVVGLLVLLAVLGGSAVVVAHPGGPSPESTTDVSTAETFDTTTTMWIELGGGGDAHWNVSMAATLPDQDAVDSFRDLAASFEANDSDVLSPETFRRYVWLADNSTTRDMSLSAVERDAVVSNDTGRLELSFTWRNFGLREGSTVHVEDAFTGSEGLWLQGLTADQRLVVSIPESFEITSSPKRITNRTIRWDGPMDFQRSDFEITYDVDPPQTTTDPAPTTTQSTPPTPTTTSSVTTEPTETTPVGPTQGGGIPPAVIVLVVVAVAAVGVYVFRNGTALPLPESSEGPDGATETVTDDHSGGSSAALPTSDGDETATSPSDETGDGPTDDAAAGGSASPGPGTTDDEPPIDRELLSDEEYVEALIERNGGRMKQANIVSETGWSNAKVSQLLSAMAEEGRIEKLRIGRENLISFPDDDGDD